MSDLLSGYNEISNENLVDPGFVGGAAVGAGRPEPDRAAASYRAIGDEVSSPAIRPASIIRGQPIQCSGAATGSGGACF